MKSVGKVYKWNTNRYQNRWYCFNCTVNLYHITEELPMNGNTMLPISELNSLRFISIQVTLLGHIKVILEMAQMVNTQLQTLRFNLNYNGVVVRYSDQFKYLQFQNVAMKVRMFQ